MLVITYRSCRLKNYCHMLKHCIPTEIGYFSKIIQLCIKKKQHRATYQLSKVYLVRRMAIFLTKSLTVISRVCQRIKLMINTEVWIYTQSKLIILPFCVIETNYLMEEFFLSLEIAVKDL